MNEAVWFVCKACGYRVRRRKETTRAYGQPKKYPIGGDAVDVCSDCFLDLTRPLSVVIE